MYQEIYDRTNVTVRLCRLLNKSEEAKIYLNLKQQNLNSFVDINSQIKIKAQTHILESCYIEDTEDRKFSTTANGPKLLATVVNISIPNV